MNYAALQNAVQDAVENTFLADDFATMTKLAEQRIYNSVQLPTLRKSVTLAFAPGDPFLQVPADFLAPLSFAAISAGGDYSYLLNKDVNFIREAYPNPAIVGIPKYYALFGTQPATDLVQWLFVGPSPSSNFSAQLNYFYYPESIVTAGNTWLGENFDSVLFNAVMVEAARWMKQEPDVVAMMDKEYAQSITLLKNLGDGKNTTDQYRSGLPRVPIK